MLPQQSRPERALLNAIFFAIVAIAFATAALRQLFWAPIDPAVAGPMAVMTEKIIEAAKGSVTLAIGLIGVMALFLGLMKVAEAGSWPFPALPVGERNSLQGDRLSGNICRGSHRGCR